ncbi:MAG: type II toxin-antitoxin system prevent-host-death family antitoxin [marine benthic group bacterium]|nr:type II toxin-antitoxin system prevent-host-death family antitoxin [Candidatus Benthicola marisminoris]
MSRTLSVAQAKATFAACVRWAEDGEPIIISRHGKPVAALVQVSDVERLNQLRAAGPEGGLASLAGGWKGSEQLARLVRRGRR